MSSPTPRHDVLGGSAVAVWIVGMGIVLGAEEPAWQIAGAGMWAAGLAVGVGVGVHAYRRHSRYPE